MLYPSLCRFPMIMLSCQSVHPEAMAAAKVDWNKCRLTGSRISCQKHLPAAWATTQYLRWDMEEICYGENHLAHVMLIALPSILLYALGLPLGAGLILWRNREFHTSKKMRFRLGLIYSGFRQNRWWWEAVVVLRKLAIIFFSSFMYTDALQVQFALGMMITAYALHHMFMPFDESRAGNHHSLHVLERNSILVSTLLLWAATIFIETKTCEDSFCYILLLAVMVSNITFLVQGLVMFARFFLAKHHRVVEKLYSYIPSALTRLSSFRIRGEPSDGGAGVEPGGVDGGGGGEGEEGGGGGGGGEGGGGRDSDKDNDDASVTIREIEMGIAQRGEPRRKKDAGNGNKGRGGKMTSDEDRPMFVPNPVAGWFREQDPSSGRFYLYNAEGESKWETGEGGTEAEAETITFSNPL
jgi:hypothetical protein